MHSPGARRSPAGSPAACHRETRSSPTSPSSTGSRGRSSRCAAGTRCIHCPAGLRSRRSTEHGPRLVLELAHQPGVSAPAFVFVHQHHEERGRVGVAVVGGVRPFLERGELAVAHLVKDAARVLVPEVVELRSLPGGQSSQRGRREVRREGQRLKAGEDRIAAEQGHEPGKSCGRERVAGDDRCLETQRGEVDQAATVSGPEGVRVAVEDGRARHPGVEIVGHRVCPGRSRPSPEGFFRMHRHTRVVGDHAKLGRPPLLGADRHLEGQALRVDHRRLVGSDPRLACEGLPLVTEHQAVVLDDVRVVTLLLQGVLDLEEIGEVRSHLDPHLERHRVGPMIQDGQGLVEPLGHRAPTDDRHVGVDVDRAGPRHQEEACLVVLQVVGRERVEPLAVDGQHPSREVTGVEREQPGRVGERGLDVTPLVADHEDVAVEDLDEFFAHRAVSF